MLLHLMTQALAKVSTFVGYVHQLVWEETKVLMNDDMQSSLICATSQELDFIKGSLGCQSEDAIPSLED